MVSGSGWLLSADAGFYLTEEKKDARNLLFLTN